MKNDQNTDGDGFELDKLDISSIPQPPKPEVSVNDSDNSIDLDEPEDAKPSRRRRKPEQGQKRRPLIMISVLTGVAVLTILVFLYISYFHPVESDKNAKSVLPIAKKIEYLSIGPIKSWTEMTGNIRLTIKIGFDDPRLKEIIPKREDAIVKRLSYYIRDPQVAQLVIKKDYNSLKKLLLNEINSFLETKNIKELYFSELITY